jgi:hypothetical protein
MAKSEKRKGEMPFDFGGKSKGISSMTILLDAF